MGRCELLDLNTLMTYHLVTRRQRRNHFSILRTTICRKDIMPGLPSRPKASDLQAGNNDGADGPGPPQTPSRIRVKNRRKRYLDLHPGYFGPSLELAGVLLS